ncbi:hypothetical protein JXA32_07715 [Candidatus Sumerlaeota bacterium]|nr:hypothetical protein [Candidatus Sumerlaeota bacterium]
MNAQMENWTRRFLLLTMALALTAGGFGCKKIQSNMKRNKFEKLQTQAEPYRPFHHEKDRAEQAQQQYDAGQQAFSGADFETALNRFNEAVNIQREVLDESRRKEAKEQFDEATVERRIAEKNDGATLGEGPEDYQKIISMHDETKELYDNGKYDDVIENSKIIIEDVRQLLLKLKNQAESKIQAAKSQRESMEAHECSRYAPEFVQDVERLIQEAEAQASFEVRHYKNTIDRADEAIRRAGEGITEAQRVIALNEISEVETLQGIAIGLDAEKWVPEEWKKAQQDYETMKDVYDQKQDYVRSRDMAIQLKSFCEQMIVDTRREIASDAIAKLNAEFTRIVNENAKLYLESDVNSLDGILKATQDLYDKQADANYFSNEYERVKNIAEQGLLECESLWRSFDSYTVEEIQQARSRHDVAREVFDKMQKVFWPKENEYIKRIDLEFENNKQTLQTTLDATLSQVDRDIERADQLRIEEQKYHNAIKLARESGERSNEALAQTYNVVAHNAINEVADQLSRWERDGGKEWADEQIFACQSSIDEAITLRDLEQYEESIRKSAEARWKLDFAIQKIEQKAVAEVQSAQRKIQQALDEKALVFTTDEIKEAEALYQDAQNQMEQEHLKDAVLQAQQAQDIADRARETSTELWTRDEIQQAVMQVRMSQDAGAAQYSGELLDKAENELAAARKLLDEKKYNTARLVASQVQEDASRSRYYLIDQAEDRTDIARQYGGWSYDRPTMTEAIRNNKVSREMMERQDYETANQLAREAIALAGQTLDLSKRKAYQEELVKIQETIKILMGSGAKYYQKDQIEKMMQESDALRRAFQADDFAENFDEYFNRMQALYKDLTDTLAMTGDVLEAYINKEKQRVERIEGMDESVFLRTELDEINSLLNIAHVEFNLKQNYFQSYDSLRKADGRLNKIEKGLEQDIYLDDVREILTELSTAKSKFSDILSMNRKTLKSFTQGHGGQNQYVAIVGRLSPYEFRAKMDELFTRASILAPPAGSGLDIVQDELVIMLTDARRAAMNFEKLMIVEEYDNQTIGSIIDRAYDLMAKVNKAHAGLAEQLLHKGTSTHSI